MKNEIKYLIYARKSSEDEDRQVASIDDQIKILKNKATELNLKIVDVISEAKSAKAPGRPEFNKLLERIKKGEASGIIAYKLDRLARNPIDGGQISWMLQGNILKHIQTCERGYFPTDNVLMMSVEFGMANQFVRELSTNVKRGLHSKVEKGWYPERSPIGYLNTKAEERGNNYIIVDPERFDLVRKMWDFMLTGNYSVAQIGRIAAKELHLKTKATKKHPSKVLSMSGVYRMFTNIRSKNLTVFSSCLVRMVGRGCSGINFRSRELCAVSVEV